MNHLGTDQTAATAAAIAFAGGAAAQDVGEAGQAGNSMLFRSMPADLYHADRSAVSCSQLKPIFISPAHFRAALAKRSTSSDAKDFGSLVHVLVLQPQLLAQEFAIYPGVADGRAKEYKEFTETHGDRTVVDEPTFSAARALAQKILERKVMGRPFGDFVREGIPEASIYFDEPTTGLRLRVRLDLWHPEFTFDLKTTRHGVAQAFLRDAVDMHYDFQAFMYSMAVALYEGRDAAKPFIFVAAESETPHSINVVTAGNSFMNNGCRKYQEAISIYTACSQQGYWPDSGSDMTAEIEHWQEFRPDDSWKRQLAVA